MNKNLLVKTMSGIGGAVTGGAVGVMAGVVQAPISAGLALTAPVSYPILGLISAASYDEPKQQAVSVVASLCMIPLAPFAFFTSPLLPITHGVLGAIGGGALAVLVAEDQLK